MLDIDVISVNSQSQNVRFFRNSNSDATGFIHIHDPGEPTVKAVFVAATGSAAFGTGTVDSNAMLTVEGAISLDEISAPSNTADRGQLYTNADNHLHFINGAGTDIKVTEEVFIVALSDHTTDLAASTTTSVASLIMPFSMTITEVSAFVNTAPAGSNIKVDIHKLAYNSGLYNGTATTILHPTDKIVIDATERNSVNSTTTVNIVTASVDQHDELTFFIDQVGSSTRGKGLKVIIKGVRA